MQMQMRTPNAAAQRAAGRVPRRVRVAAATVESTTAIREERAEKVTKHFPGALDVDSFIGRVEAALIPEGFKGSNSIAVTNLCRDEATVMLRDKIEGVFGSSFNVMGLGGVLTCGCTGFGAGFSHSPICSEGRERYVFFSLPHIAISESGVVGEMSRPGRPGISNACGAMLKLLGEMKNEGVTRSLGGGLYDVADPEYSILKNRVVSQSVQDSNIPTNLVEMTQLAERAITNDLQWLISKTVDTKKADYAVFTGVQIHNWAANLEDPNAESFEFVWPTKAYAVVNGVRKEIDLSAVKPSAAASTAFEEGVTPVEYPYLMGRLIGGGKTTPGSSAPATPVSSAPSSPAKEGFLASLEKMFK